MCKECLQNKPKKALQLAKFTILLLAVKSPFYSHLVTCSSKQSSQWIMGIMCAKFARTLDAIDINTHDLLNENVKTPQSIWIAVATAPSRWNLIVYRKLRCAFCDVPVFVNLQHSNNYAVIIQKPYFYCSKKTVLRTKKDLYIDMMMLCFNINF